MSVNKEFVVRHGLDVADSLINADGTTRKVGIGTTIAERELHVEGDIAITGKLYAAAEVTGIGTTGILDSNYPSYITGINTSDFRVHDFVYDGVGGSLSNLTKVTSIGIGSVGISPSHSVTVGVATTSITIARKLYAGNPNDLLISRGENEPPVWTSFTGAGFGVTDTTAFAVGLDTNTFYPTFTSGIGLSVFYNDQLAYIPEPGNLGIGSTLPQERLVVDGNAIVNGSANFSESISVGTTVFVGVLTATSNISSGASITAATLYGNGIGLSGIVTQISAGIGIRLSSSEAEGKGTVTIDSYYPVGKTIFVTQNGNDTNSGLSELHSKRTIKAAAAIAFPGDTIKVFPGVYIESNPIYLSKRVAVEGTELRNCIVTPRYLDRDLFYVNNGCHITDLSFVGEEMTDGASIIALQPLSGVTTDRFFDAARMIRYNLDFIAAEAVGYLTSTDYKNPAFVVVNSSGTPTSSVNCSDDIKDVMKAVIHDITRGGNLKCVGAGKSYYNDAGSLLHITGTDTNGYSVKDATVDALNYAAGIARSCINNVSWTGNYQSVYTQIKDLSMQADPSTGSNEDIGSCANVVSAIYSCVGVVTAIVGTGLTALGGVSGINTTFPSNAGIGTTSIIDITSATYDNTTGETVITAPNFSVKIGDIVELRDLVFSCASGAGIGTTTQRFPSGNYGYFFDVSGISTGTFTVNTGISTIPHTYVSGGFVVDRSIEIDSVSYDSTTGVTTITAPNAYVKVGDLVSVRDITLGFSSVTTLVSTATTDLPSGVSTVYVNSLLGVNPALDTFTGGGLLNVGIVTVGVGGTEILGYPGLYVEVETPTTVGIETGDSITFSRPDTLSYPIGDTGLEFKVTEVIGSGTTFVINTGISTISYSYEGGGVVIPPYSPGVGPITQGPYIRNCTNFVPSSIGMKVDGFNAEPGDLDDIGVTGTMSVDSYTQYNQGGIGVSITNGAYSQLVSLFTICDDIAIFTGSGGQCDITNSNSSFGRLGLVANGVGDATSKSIYRYTGTAVTDVTRGNNVMAISGVGTFRPYDGQVCYFGELYNFVDTITISNSGTGYVSPPRVTISAPEGENGITAQATSEIDAFGRVSAINILNSGSQYLNAPTVTIDPPVGVGVTATATVTKLQPIYYKVDSATLPSAGISTVSFLQTLNNTVSAGTTVYFTRVSLQITSSHSFEWVGSGNNINAAKPALGGVAIPENEVVQDNGGIVVYTSTDQAGNFKIGDGVIINQATGQITGRDFTKALFTTMTPFILALSD